ncbi:MAG: hypothetical protein ACI4TK_18835 [Agathobacter sp.]
MFEKFGEFDSAEEINVTAEGLRTEGDTESLYAMAEENGIEKEDVEDYLDGYTSELVNPLMAALGKIAIEEKELKPQHIMVDWVNYIKSQCVAKEDVARAVRRKGKSIKECIAAILKYSFSIRAEVDKDICRAAGISNARVDIGIPNAAKVKELINKYYLG